MGWGFSRNCLDATAAESRLGDDERHYACTGCGCDCHKTTRPPANFRDVFEAQRAEADAKREAELAEVRAEFEEGSDVVW